MMEIIAVGIAGFFGAIARYGASVTIGRAPGAQGFPWATLAINVSGSFLIGFAYAVASAKAAAKANRFNLIMFVLPNRTSRCII